MARDKIGSFVEVSDVENTLNRWIKNYVNANDTTGREVRSKYPLRDAKVVVQPITGQPGSFAAIAWLKPWLEFEELTTSIRLEVRIPKWAGLARAYGP
jgi:type VI secretion system protein ImpC